ncbi:DUF4157 domain-containing protein [Aquimarina sp. AD10]|uniref:eCIS core domain-containing protein n=1 Tax=Aquimarina sp. AD10 TaxID=1714849 RepID=UPI000E4BD407|nr:DUF4157 domain-containing protein [Aquimarina sp. AD10]AXT61547.1 DUF4157 domain-containing protein [Aquimarina sp. AD10]RKM90030.1 DUF4157 domain-containing protein [Aquimarina sp. AD10]
MKTAEIKTSSAAKNPVQAKREPFFKKEGEEGFFSKSGETSEPFFSPASIQPKLTIGQPNDKYEVEADKKADQVVQKLAEPANPTSTKTQTENLQKKEDDEVLQNKLEIQRKPIFESNAEQQEPNVQTKPIAPIQPSLTGDQDEELQKKEEEFSESEEEIHTKLSSAENPSTPNEESTIQRKEEGSSTNTTDLESSLNSSKGSGSALPSNTQESMGNAFGADFSGVRTHTGGDAIQMNKDLGSQAFTHGNDIYFNEGKYNTNSTSGQHLLAHELTHTMQQGASKPTVQKVDEPTSEVTETPTAAEAAIRPNDALDISHRFDLTTAWANYLDAQYNDGERIFDVDVKIGERYSGTIKVNKTTRNIQGDAAKYELSEGNHKYLNITGWNFLNPMREAGVEPILVLRNFGDEQQTKGFLSVKMGDRALVADVQGFIKGLNDKLEAMDFLGIEPLNVDALENTFENGRLVFQVSALTTVVDGFLEAGGGLGITGDAFTFNLNANVDIQGLAQGQFTVARGEDGKLSGRGEIQGDIANIQATIIAEYIDGAVTIQGTGTMTSEKFTGSITLLVTDAAKSRQMMNAALGVETMDAQAETAATPETAAPKTKNNQVLAGWGEVQAKITPWLEGTAKIGIDHEGHVTIVGEIVVPDEIELMEQRGKKVQIFDVEIRAGYGIPLVGQVFLFAGIGMFVNAGFGPLVLKDVGFTGTYSTDPSVLQQFSITGTLGINAFAVLGLEAEAGVGVTLLGHDVKAGVNVTAAAGLRAYAEATPTFQYTESAAPEGGKVGESRLKGHFEAAAQLFLQLSGALFYELDSPWWSPAPDGREETPLGEVQYPIGDSMGIGADIDWLVGSSDAPELKFSPVEFDPDKFTADVMADPPPRRMGDADANPEGQWTGEPGGEQNANPEVTGDGEGLPPSSRREENLQNLPDEQKYMRALDEMSQLENADPKPTEGVVEAKARRVKAKYGLNQIQLRNKQDDNVSVFVRHAREDNGNHLLVVPLMSEAERRRLLSDAMTDLRTRETNAAGEDGTIEEAAAQSMLQSWLRAHPAIESARVVDGGETWDYLIDVGDRNNTETGRLKGGSTENAGEVTEGEETTNQEDVGTIIGMSSPINIDGGHTLKIEGSLERVEFNVYSDKKTLNNLLNEKRQEIHDNGTSDENYEAKSRAIESLFSEKRVLGTNIGAYKRAVDNAYTAGHGNEPVRNAYNLIATNLTNISADLVIVGVLEHTIELPISRVSFETDSKGRAYILRAAPLSKIPGNTRGSTPTQDPQGWSNIPVTLRRGGAWVRAHMLNHRLHGPGTRSNLFPGTRDMNLRDMENQVERLAKEAVWDNNQVIFYNVDVSYGNAGQFEDIPTVVAMSFGPYNTETNSPESPTVTKRFTQEPPSTATRVTINNATAGALNSKAVAEGGTNGAGLSGFFDRLVQGRPSSGYQNIIQIRTIVSGLYVDQNAFMSAYVKFNNLVNTNILEYD